MIFAAAFVVVSTLLADALTTEFGFTNNPDSKKADTLLEERLRGPRRIGEFLIVRSDTLTVDDPAFKRRVEELFAEILALESAVEVDPSGFPPASPDPSEGPPRAVIGGTHYYQTGDESLVSKDRKTTMLPLVMAGSLDQATDNMEQVVLDTVRDADGKDGFKVLVAGESSIAAESNELTVKEIERGERIGVPLALVILLLLFGALVAALMPIGLAIVAIIVALGMTALVGQVFDLIFFVTLMITMIGLAVGIDYSLIFVSRFREEMGRGLDKSAAVARSGATAGRTVVFSGITVVVALAGMLIIPSNIYQALATGAILVVIAAVAATMTLLPAVLSLLGGGVNALRVPFIGRRVERRADDESGGGFWDWIARMVMRYPVVGLVVAGGLLVAAAVPYLDINTGFNGVDSFPDGTQGKEAFQVLEREFSFGVISPAEIVISGEVTSGSVQEAIGRLEARLEGDSDFVGRATRQDNGSDVAVLSVPVRGESSSDTAIGAIKRLRGEYIPDAFDGVNADVWVTGLTAFNLDFFDLVDTYTPIIFAVVLSLSFILPMVVFRSIVIPIKAIIMNLLSVGAAYGLMVLVFQKGVGTDLLGFQQSEIIDAWIPLFLFSVLFGLSMDYHVFLLSRIRERYDQTGDNTEAVAYGLKSTAGLITGAALIMVVVFGGFASGDVVSNQQVGFGLAIAVFLDATIVRTILVPSNMRLLGDLNWYLPPILRWLPDVRVEAEESSE